MKKAIGFMFLFVIVFLVIFMLNTDKKIAEKKKILTAKDESIAELTQSLNKLYKDSKELDDIKLEKKDLVFIKSIGDKVAGYQNQYFNETGMNNRKSLESEIRSYFDDTAPDKVTKPWFDIENLNSEWKFLTTYGSDDRYIDSVWICYFNLDDKPIPGAFAFAKYDTSTKLFKDFAVYITREAESKRVLEGADNHPSVKDSIESMRGYFEQLDGQTEPVPNNNDMGTAGTFEDERIKAAEEEIKKDLNKIRERRNR